MSHDNRINCYCHKNKYIKNLISIDSFKHYKYNEFIFLLTNKLLIVYNIILKTIKKINHECDNLNFCYQNGTTSYILFIENVYHWLVVKKLYLYNINTENFSQINFIDEVNLYEANCYGDYIVTITIDGKIKIYNIMSKISKNLSNAFINLYGDRTRYRMDMQNDILYLYCINRNIYANEMGKFYITNIDFNK
jgi:hypothetical protein